MMCEKTKTPSDKLFVVTSKETGKEINVCAEAIQNFTKEFTVTKEQLACLPSGLAALFSSKKTKSTQPAPKAKAAKVVKTSTKKSTKKSKK